MKGMGQFAVVLIAVALVVGVLYVSGSKLTSVGAELIKGSVVTQCNANEKLVQDASQCGVTVELNQHGSYGVCLNWQCPESIGNAQVDHCIVYIPSVPVLDADTCLESSPFKEPNTLHVLSPGQSFSFSDWCAKSNQQQTFMSACKNIYTKTPNSCCVSNVIPCQDECSGSDLRCNANSVQVCSEPTAQKYCKHWETSVSCPTGTTCNSPDRLTAQCVTGCSSQFDCTLTDVAGNKLEYCGQDGICHTKKTNGQVCSGSISSCQIGVTPCLGNGFECFTGCCYVDFTGGKCANCLPQCEPLGGNCNLGVSCCSGLTCQGGFCGKAPNVECAKDSDCSIGKKCTLGTLGFLGIGTWHCEADYSRILIGSVFLSFLVVFAVFVLSFFMPVLKVIRNMSFIIVSLLFLTVLFFFAGWGLVGASLVGL